MGLGVGGVTAGGEVGTKNDNGRAVLRAHCRWLWLVAGGGV